MCADAHGILLVIINNFDTVCRAVCPDKADTPLGVDTYAMLTSSITLELFQSVRGWNAEIFKAFRRVEHIELA
ncbi:hypothetical protein Bwad003_26590 [Bilophila wadsworthia]